MVTKKSKVIVRQVRSANGHTKRTKATLSALGLRGIGTEAEHILTPPTEGMIRAVQHLVLLQASAK